MNEKKELMDIFNAIEFEYEIQKLDKLCDRAKYYAISYLLNANQSTKYFLEYEPYRSELTPIEQIFCAVYFQYINDFYIWRKSEIIKTNVPIVIMFWEELMAQKEIVYEGKKYIADFVIDFSRKSLKDGSYIYADVHNLKYVIELDGHNYHSSKTQVAYDYERENNLKELGFKVIRFTGRQIYEEPYTCVDKLVSIIVNDIKGASNYGDNTN